MAQPRSFKRVVITGIAGSGGSYLAEYIVNFQPEVEVHGFARWHSTTADADNLRAIRSKITMHEVDLNDMSSVLTTLQKVKPDCIFHLASYANVRTSFQTPNTVLSNNILGTSNLLEALRILGQNPWFQMCSTSEVYGQVDPKNVPITEEAPIRPASPYAVSKVAQDLLSWTYWTGYKMNIIRTRMFTYLNPRRLDIFATHFARQVALIEVGLAKELVHGNLDSVRTMVDVRDAMRAYWEAALYCEPGEVYNIGGPTTMTVGEFLKMLVGIARVPIPVRQDPALLRPSDITLQIPAVGKFIKATGWKPKYSFEESVAFLLDYWRGEAQQALFRAQRGDKA